MMLSGLGPKQHLQDMGLKVRKDIPGVGANLQDHIVAFYNVHAKDQSLFANLWSLLNPFNAILYYFRGYGVPYGDNGIGYGAFFDSGRTKNDKFDRRDIQLHVLPVSWNSDFGLGLPSLLGLKKDYVEKLLKVMNMIHLACYFPHF